MTFELGGFFYVHGRQYIFPIDGKLIQKLQSLRNSFFFDSVKLTWRIDFLLLIHDFIFEKKTTSVKCINNRPV